MDNEKFCSHSRGSSYEVLDHLITACDEDLLPPEMLAKGRKLVESAVKLINGYMRYLKNQAKPPPSIREDISTYKTTTPLHNPDYQILNNK